MVNNPNIRFAGFSDEWVQRKLGDVLDISKTKNKAEQYGKVDVLSVSREVGTVNQIKYQGRSFAGSDLSNYKVVQGGELIYTKSPLKGAPYGIFQVATIKGILSPLYAVYTSTDKAYTPFVAMALKNDNIATHYLTPLVTKGAKNTINVTDEGALDGKIQFPSILEQRQIFIFFKKLDNTITHHQRKLDLLKDLKKGYLQKMFPKNGAKVPEWRFAGFADDWEERELGEVFNQTVEYINPNEANLELWSVTVERGLTPKTARYNREALVKKNDKFKVVHDGDIVYNPMNLTIGAVGFNKSEKSVAVSGYYVTMNMNSGFNNSYFQTWLKSENAIKQYKLYATGSLIEKQRVQFPTLSLIKSYIPTFEEQQKIGSFFKQLDNTIALHQRTLDLLKNLKKGLLQQMFV